MARSWRVARSLDALLAQINAHAPRRSKRSDGSIGDAAHSARASDHNPDGRGIVHARDFTHDPKGGFDAHAFADRLAAAGDRRVKYIISRGRIHNPSIDGRGTGRWRRYTGSNPHNQHVHVSVVYSRLEDDTSPWPGLGTAVRAETTAPAPVEKEWYDMLTQVSERRAKRQNLKPRSKGNVLLFNEKGHKFPIKGPDGAVQIAATIHLDHLKSGSVDLSIAEVIDGKRISRRLATVQVTGGTATVTAPLWILKDKRGALAVVIDSYTDEWARVNRLEITGARSKA